MQNEVENKELPQQSIIENTETQDIVTVTQDVEEINWKKFRETREMERKQKEEALKIAAQKEAEAQALKQAMDALLNKNQAPSSPSHYEEDETEDQRIEKKVQAALLKKEQQFIQERQQREQQELPQRLNSTYKDFDQVCNTENLDYLEYHYPELATPFKHMPDSFDKWASLYQAVKRLVPNTNGKKDQAKAEKNFAKPQSMAVGGATQTGDTPPIRLEEKRRADNWARMQRVMKGA